jgi:hypothetical protein
MAQAGAEKPSLRGAKRRGNPEPQTTIAVALDRYVASLLAMTTKEFL